MLKLKKIISLLTASVMTFSCVIPSFAQETAAETDTSKWNTQLVDESAIPTYESFPVRISKNIPEEMKMDMSFQYLKNIGSGDRVEVTIINQFDNTVVLEEALTADDVTFVLNDIPNNEYYKITVSETLDGEYTTYTGYIQTKNIAVDFPVDMTLGNNVISSEIDAEWSSVLIKKVGDVPECNHSEDEECTDECSLFSCIDILSSDDMNTFYNALDANGYYEMQVTATVEMVSDLYRGYISTYPGGEYEGVFTRGYSFSTEPVSPISTYGLDSTTSEFDPNFDTPIEYELYRNINISQTGSKTVATVKFIPPQTGYYTIETIGNADVMFEIYSENNGVMRDGYDSVRSGGTGENPRYRFGVLVNNDEEEGTLYRPVKYIVVGLEDGVAAPYSFRIIREIDGESDDVTNYLDEVEAECDSAIYAQPTNQKRMNYYGDVDVYGYNSTTTGTGYVKITSEGESTDADIYTLSQDGSGNTILWSAGTRNSTSSNDSNAAMTFSKGRYYVEVHQNTDTLPPFSIDSDEYYNDPVYKYTLDFYHPAQKDAVDLAANATYGNSTPVYVTEITVPYTNNTMTLCKGDTDYFKFTTDETGGDLTVEVSEVSDESGSNKKLYIPELYDWDDVEIVSDNPPEWYTLYTIAEYSTVTENDKQKNVLTYSGLLPSHDYLIGVKRPDSSTYDVYHPYTLNVTVTEPQIPTATLSGNVALSHTYGTSITNLNAMYTAVMESLTCYINGVAVDDGESLADVKLYYNDTELTASMVSVMGTGDYVLTVKYQDVAATGGTITLTVAEEVIEADDIKTVSITNKVQAEEEFLDWAAAIKMLVDTRLGREGLSATTVDAFDISDTYGEWEVRADMATAISAANDLYNAAKNTTDSPSTVFRTGSVSASSIMTTAYNQLNAGKPIVALLTDSSDTTDMSLARYVIIVGVNRTQGTYQIIDPFENYQLVVEISSDTFLNGGYLGRTNLKFSGRISEVS